MIAIDSILKYQFVNLIKHLMKQVEASLKKISSKVKAVFQHPHHYVTVIQRQDNFIYLYDQKVMSEVSVSTMPFNQKIIHLVFSSNLGTFYAFCRSKSSLNNFQYCSYLAIFAINECGKIQIKRSLVSRNGKPIAIVINCMGLLSIQQQEQKRDVLICLEESTYSLINLQGCILANQKLVCQNRNLQKSKCYPLSKNTFLIAEQYFLMKATIEYEKSQLLPQLKFQQKIVNIFMDQSPKKKYIGILLQDHLVQIISISTSQYKIYYNLVIPSFLITNLCFLYPAVNTSSTNKYKDKVYVVFSGITTAKCQESKRNGDLGTNNTAMSPRNIYCYEFRQLRILNNRQMIKLKQSNIFFIQNIGTIKHIILNQHQYNCIRVLNEQHQLISYNVILMLTGSQLDQQWIYLTYKFERCHLDRSFYYEEAENQFQNIQQIRGISQDELDDWSFSSLPYKQLREMKNRRAPNLLMF